MSRVQIDLDGAVVDREIAVARLEATAGHLASDKRDIDGLETRSDYQRRDDERGYFCRICHNPITVGTNPTDEYGHRRDDFEARVGNSGERYEFDEGCPFKIEFSEGRW